MSETNESIKMLTEIREGKVVKMHYARDGPVDMIIQLVAAPEKPKAIVKEQRIRDGKVQAERFVGQPEMERLVKSRSWWSAWEPEEVDDDDEPETHECEECGKEFDTERGVAIHAGHVHKEEGEDEEAEADEPSAAEQDEGQLAVADGGVDVDKYDIDPTELDLEEGSRWRDSTNSVTHHLDKIADTDLWVAWSSWMTGDGEATSVKGIGRVSVDGVELDEDVIAETMREEADRLISSVPEGHEEEADLYRAVADAADKFAAGLAEEWSERAVPEVLGDLIHDGYVGVEKTLVWAEVQEPYRVEVEEQWLEVGSEVLDEWPEGEPEKEAKGLLRSGLEAAVKKHCRQWRAPHGEYFGRLRFEAAPWEMRALELRQHGVFQNKPRLSQSMALREEGKTQREAADILGLAASTISEHWSRQDGLLRRAKWTVKHVGATK